MSFYQSALLSTNVIGVWDLYLQVRQRRSYYRTDLPVEFRSVLSEEEYAKNQCYGRDHAKLSIIEGIKSLVVANAELLMKIPSKLYYWVAAHSHQTVGSFAHSYLFGVASDIVSTLIGLPFSYYSNFVVEKKHGFNKMTKMEFVKDEIKSFLLRIALLHPLQTALIQFVVQKFGERFPLYFFAGTTVLLVAFTFIYPTLIMPLFNKFTPLDTDGDLHRKIKALADKLQYPLTAVYVVDGSRRSAHSNAYMYGFWKNKRVVLYDTLIDQMKDKDENIVAVLCHEFGHWYHKHTMINLALSLTQLMGFSYGAKAVIFNGEMYRQFGFQEMNPVIGFDIFSQVFLQPYGELFGYGMSFLSRRFEFQADRFAVRHGYGAAMKDGLVILVKENKSGLTPDPLYSALNYSHPPTIERLHAIDAEMKKQE